jgi:nitroreductase
MEVYDTIRTVLAVRAFQAKPVPRETIRRIVEAARLTASSMNGQPWHFIVVEKPEELRQLGGLLRTGPYVAQAALAVVVAIDKTQYAVSDASRAIQSMILAAWSEGVGSNWAGFIGGLDSIKPLLNIPKDIDVLAVVPFGYPVKSIGRGKKNRKPAAEVINGGKFGEPFV